MTGSPEYALADSLELLGETIVHDSGTITYGELVLSIAPKEGKANTLLADHLFSPSLLLAERIERGLLPVSGRTVVELGAGCALPSLLAATQADAPALVVVTDYPSDIILSNLERNVSQNTHLARRGCRVACVGYEWGSDASAVLHELAMHGSSLDRPRPRGDAEEGYDVVIMSDLLHFDSSHGVLVSSLVALLGRHGDARVYVGAGKYTAWSVCEAFLGEASRRGIEWTGECSRDDGERDVWLGEMAVGDMNREDLGRRKGNCWWWVGRWGGEVV